jgi:RNA polymerase sigma factor (sigma-70 family)
VTSDDDQARFADVVLPHLADAYALARWITGDRTDAEDVVQDACLRAFRAIGSFGGDNARAWTLTIVRNTAYTWMTRRGATPVVAVGGLGDLDEVDRAQSHDDAEATQAPTPETALIAKADAARLEAAIATLPPLFRETLVLRDLHGLDYREIAQVTGVPIGTVMSRLARARRRVIATIGAER